MDGWVIIGGWIDLFFIDVFLRVNIEKGEDSYTLNCYDWSD